MLREIAHFVRVAPEVMRMQKEHSRADFVELLTTRADQEGYRALREAVVDGLSGRVLEIGCGTGAMFGYYPSDVQVDAIEPEEDFLALALDKAERSGGRVRASAGDAMALGFPDQSFDGVVMSLVLCSVPSVETVLREAFRVLRPGGQLRALEHVRSDRLVGGALMRAFNPLWLKLNGQGCNLDRDPVAPIQDAGFVLDDVVSTQLFDTVAPAFPLRSVRAHRPGS